MIETSPPPADVLLPCLDEVEALPWVLDGSADTARALGAHVVHEPRRGFGAACHAGPVAATADVTCFRDRDASLEPGLLPRSRFAAMPASPAEVAQ